MIELSGRHRNLLNALYPLIAALVLQRFVEFFISITPLQLDDASWRFGAAGVAINSVPPIAYALVVALLVATFLGHRLTTRWIGIFTIALAVVLGLVVLSFGLDALTVRRMIRDDAKAGFDSAAFKALGIAILYTPTLLWAGWQTIQSSRLAPGTKAKGDDAPPIVVGS